MESLFGSWLLNNGVSVVIIILIFALWLSWRSRIKAIGELATHSDALAELPSKVHAVRESVTYLSDKKMDSEKAYKEFVKHDHLNVISEKTEQTLEAIRSELSNIRSDLRMIFEKVIK